MHVAEHCPSPFWLNLTADLYEHVCVFNCLCELYYSVASGGFRGQLPSPSSLLTGYMLLTK